MTKHPGHAPAVAAVLDNPLLNKGTAFTPAAAGSWAWTGSCRRRPRRWSSRRAARTGSIWPSRTTCARTST